MSRLGIVISLNPPRAVVIKGDGVLSVSIKPQSSSFRKVIEFGEFVWIRPGGVAKFANRFSQWDARKLLAHVESKNV